jgi:hypothetical protein
VLQVRERNMADASYLPENSIVKFSIAAQNVNKLFADSTDMKKYVMLAMSVYLEWTRLILNVDRQYC